MLDGKSSRSEDTFSVIKQDNVYDVYDAYSGSL